MTIIDPRSGAECTTAREVIIKCCAGRGCRQCPLGNKEGVSCIALEKEDVLYVAELAGFDIIEDDDVKQIEISSDELMGLLGG